MSSNKERTQRGRCSDVRLSGFVDRASVEEATSWIDAHSGRLTSESVKIREVAGRVLATPIRATCALPPIDCVRSDGYAVRAAETVGAGDYNPLPLILSECKNSLPAGAADCVVAGESMLVGADAVLPFEAARAEGATLEVFSAVAEGYGVELKGQQLQAGTLLIEAGSVLRPQDAGLLASLRMESVEVVRRPRIRLVIAGPKFSSATEALGDALTPMLAALVARDGAMIETSIAGANDRESIACAVSAPGVDALLVAGRTGTGVDDQAPLAIADVGELAIHGIALRPGGSAGMGLVGGVPVVLLPGDPLACWCAYEILAGRLIRGLAGLDPGLPFAARQAEVGRKIVSAIGLVDVCRVRLSNGKVEPIGSPESGGLASVVQADGFVIAAAPLEGYAPGDCITVYIYGRAHSGSSN
jgi:molybdopterin molybdotransferase